MSLKYAYMIQLCCTSVNFFIPQPFTGVLTPHTIKKHTIPRVMTKSRGDRTKSKEYKAALCNFCPYSCGNEDSAYSHVCHLHLCITLGCTAMWSMPVVLTEMENENDSVNQNYIAKMMLHK